MPDYSDGTYTGTLRVYRADVNNYFQVPSDWNGARRGSGPFTVTLPSSGGTITEGASLVVIYRVLSLNFPLKSVIIYNGSIAPTSATGNIPQAVQGYYDAVNGANGTGEVTHLYTSGGSWNDSESSPTLGQSNQYIDTLSPGNAYAAVILSTPVNNSDDDGILDAWKTAQGYTDVKTGTWVALPGATHGRRTCSFNSISCARPNRNNTCDLTQPNLYPSPDAQGNDPLAMVTQAFANYGVHLHLKPGNAFQSHACTDSPTQTCEFPNQPGSGRLEWQRRALEGLAGQLFRLHYEPVACQLRAPFPLWSEGQLSLRIVWLLSRDPGLDYPRWIHYFNHHDGRHQRGHRDHRYHGPRH